MKKKKQRYKKPSLKKILSEKNLKDFEAIAVSPPGSDQQG